MGKKKWIQKAVSKEGSFTRTCKNEGLSMSQCIKKHEHEGGKAGKRARLAKTLRRLPDRT